MKKEKNNFESIVKDSFIQLIINVLIQTKEFDNSLLFDGKFLKPNSDINKQEYFSKLYPDTQPWVVTEIDSNGVENIKVYDISKHKDDMFEIMNIINDYILRIKTGN